MQHYFKVIVCNWSNIVVKFSNLWEAKNVKIYLKASNGFII